MSHGGLIALEVPAYRTSDGSGLCSSCLSHSACFDIFGARRAAIAAGRRVALVRFAFAIARLGMRDVGIETNFLTGEAVFCWPVREAAYIVRRGRKSRRIGEAFLYALLRGHGRANRHGLDSSNPAVSQPDFDPARVVPPGQDIADDARHAAPRGLVCLEHDVDSCTRDDLLCRGYSWHYALCRLSLLLLLLLPLPQSALPFKPNEKDSHAADEA